MNYFDTKKLAGYIGGEVSSDVMDEEPKTTRELQTTLAEHKKTCEARPGNCPFEKDLQAKIEESKKGEQGDADTDKANSVPEKKKDFSKRPFDYGPSELNGTGGLVWDDVFTDEIEPDVLTRLMGVKTDCIEFGDDSGILDGFGTFSYTTTFVNGIATYEDNPDGPGLVMKMSLEPVERHEDVSKDMEKCNEELSKIGLQIKSKDSPEYRFTQFHSTIEDEVSAKDEYEIEVSDPVKYQNYLNSERFQEVAKRAMERWRDD